MRQTARALTPAPGLKTRPTDVSVRARLLPLDELRAVHEPRDREPARRTRTVESCEMVRGGVLLHDHFHVRGRPAALLALATVARGVVDLRAHDVLARRSEGRRGLRLEEQFRVAFVEERNPL